eukprot:1159888-Pelagomonas_calceolata.AAC.9
MPSRSAERRPASKLVVSFGCQNPCPSYALGHSKQSSKCIPCSPPYTRGAGKGRFHQSAGCPDLQPQQRGKSYKVSEVFTWKFTLGCTIEVSKIEKLLDSCTVQLFSLVGRVWIRKARPGARSFFSSSFLYMLTLSLDVCREVGATSVPSNIKSEDISAEEKEKGAKPARSYTVTLLPDPRKTLGQSLPAIKLPAKRK